MTPKLLARLKMMSDADVLRALEALKDKPPLLSTTALGQRIGFHLRAGFIEHTLGVPPHVRQDPGIYWSEKQFPAIVKALSTYVLGRR